MDKNTSPGNQQQAEDINVLIKRRYEELNDLKSKGIEPFAYSFEIDSNSQDIKDNYKDEEKIIVRIAGRIMSIRRMGKASFAHIQDIGDIIGIEGYVFKTKAGEISVHITSLTLLAKSLRPLPIAKETVDEQGNKIVHDQFADIELRYRQRYVDLAVNPHLKEVFVKRSRIMAELLQDLL